MFRLEKISNSFHEKTFYFIKDIYKVSGYTFKKKDYIKYSEQRCIFNIYVDEKIFGTIALIKEKDTSPLPIYKLYKQEIDLLKRSYPKICEIGNFAIDKNSKDALGVRALYGTKTLFNEVIFEANRESIDLILIVVNPKHVSFYELMGFERIGQDLYHEDVNAEAVGLKIQSEKIKSHYFFATT